MTFGSTLYKADTWLKRTKKLGPVGVRFRQVSLYFLRCFIKNSIDIFSGLGIGCLIVDILLFDTASLFETLSGFQSTTLMPSEQHTVWLTTYFQNQLFRRSETKCLIFLTSVSERHTGCPIKNYPNLTSHYFSANEYFFKRFAGEERYAFLVLPPWLFIYQRIN